MTCIILAAGYATRLYPLTENFPKPLLKVGEKTIVDWLIDDLRETNKVKRFVIVTNHRFAHIFEEWAKEKEDVFIVDDGTSSNETRLGAVKDILYAMESLSIDDDILVLAGDNVLDFSLGQFLLYCEKKNTSCVMRYYEEDAKTLTKRGVLEIGDNDLLLGMEEKPSAPKTHWCCPPFYYYVKEDVKRIKEALDDGCGYDAPGSFVSWLLSRSPIHAMVMPGKRYDIGDIASYETVQESYKGIR